MKLNKTEGDREILDVEMEIAYSKLPTLRVNFVKTDVNKDELDDFVKFMESGGKVQETAEGEEPEPEGEEEGTPEEEAEEGTAHGGEL